MFESADEQQSLSSNSLALTGQDFFKESKIANIPLHILPIQTKYIISFSKTWMLISF